MSGQYCFVQLAAKSDGSRHLHTAKGASPVPHILK